MPTLVLAECVLTYLQPQHSDGVLGWVAASFTKPVAVIYEQIRPFDTFGHTMRNNLILVSILYF